MNSKSNQTNKMKRLTILLALLTTFQMSYGQNLAGRTFDCTLGVLDTNQPCMVDAGVQFGIDQWANSGPGCPGDNSCGFFQDADPQYNTFYFKNIVNIPVCITLNVVTGSCGANTGFWVVDGTYIPSAAGSGTDPCIANEILQSTNTGGTTSVGWEVNECAPFSINFHNGFAPANQCTYSFNIEPDPLVDLRCGDETMCIQKVTIGGTPVPTMTQWGLFLFGLILLTLGVVTIYNMSVVRSTENL